MAHNNTDEINAFLASKECTKNGDIDHAKWEFAMDMLDEFIEWNKKSFKEKYDDWGMSEGYWKDN